MPPLPHHDRETVHERVYTPRTSARVCVLVYVFAISRKKKPPTRLKFQIRAVYASTLAGGGRVKR